MPLCDQRFDDFLHPLIHEVIHKNARNEERYGKHNRWDWDQDNATLTFSDPDNSTLRIGVSVVGTTEGDSCQWSWANKNFESHGKLDMEKVREFGEANGSEQLTSPFLEADAYRGWNMTAVAVHVRDALGTYRFLTDNGHCYLIRRKFQVRLKGLEDKWGAMRGAMTAAPGVDLTEPTGEVWEAETGGGQFSKSG